MSKLAKWSAAKSSSFYESLDNSKRTNNAFNQLDEHFVDILEKFLTAGHFSTTFKFFDVNYVY